MYIHTYYCSGADVKLRSVEKFNEVLIHKLSIKYLNFKHYIWNI